MPNPNSLISQHFGKTGRRSAASFSRRITSGLSPICPKSFVTMAGPPRLPSLRLLAPAIARHASKHFCVLLHARSFRPRPRQNSFRAPSLSKVKADKDASLLSRLPHHPNEQDAHSAPPRVSPPTPGSKTLPATARPSAANRCEGIAAIETAAFANDVPSPILLYLSGISFYDFGGFNRVSSDELQQRATRRSRRIGY